MVIIIHKTAEQWRQDRLSLATDLILDEAPPGVSRVYQITWSIPPWSVEVDGSMEGTWEWENVHGMTFQGACRYGLSRCVPGKRRLIRVAWLPLVEGDNE